MPPSWQPEGHGVPRRPRLSWASCGRPWVCPGACVYMTFLSSGLPGASSPPGLRPGLPHQHCCCQLGSRRRLSSRAVCPARRRRASTALGAQGLAREHGRSWHCEAEASSGCSVHRRGCRGDSGLALGPCWCGPLGCPARGPRTGSIKGTLGPGVGPYLGPSLGHRWPPPSPRRAQNRAPHVGCTVFNVLGSSHRRAVWMTPGRVAPWACEQSSIPVR